MRELWSKLMPVILLLIGVAVYGEPAEPPDHLKLSWTEQILTYSRSERLTTECHSEVSVYACTEILRKDFECHCVRSGETWRIDASLDIEAAIRTVDPRYLIHERLHILGLRDAITKRFQRFLGLRFRKKSDCETLARHLSRPAFEADFMNAVVVSSNYMLDGTRRPDVAKPEPLLDPAPSAVLAARRD